MADLSALAIPSEPPPECNSPIPHHQVPTDATHIRANSFRDSVITEPAFGRSEHSSTSATNLRVLFVEDEPGDVELAIRAVQHRGFEVSADVTQTEKEFTNLVRSNSYDVILADYNLPSWNGMESVAILRREGLDIPVIVVSGALGELTAVECIKQGAADYVLKDGGATSSPIRGKILIRWVEACAGSFIRTARFKNRRAMGPLPRKYRGRIQIVP